MRGGILLSALLLTGCGRGMRAPGSFRHLSGDAGDYRSDRSAEQPAEQPAERAITDVPEPAAPSWSGDGRDVAAGAAKLVGKRSMAVGDKSFRYDCSGMVCAAYAHAGLDLSGSSKSLYEEAESAGILHTQALPKPGDIAFFDNSYDRNNNNRRDDELTHVAVVESVDDDGTITLIHKGGSGVSRIQMNLLRPEDSAVNSYLRATSDLDGGPRLTGQLWRAFGSFWALEDGQG